jgi:hypothetical protein
MMESERMERFVKPKVVHTKHKIKSQGTVSDPTTGRKRRKAEEDDDDKGGGSE